MIVLDTQVLLYAVGRDHPLARPCRDLIAAVGRGDLPATTTAEVIQEFAHVRARRRSRDDAVALARDFADLLSPLLPLDERALRRGFELFRRHEGLDAFDAILGGAVLETGADVLVSADGAFTGVPELSVWRPDGPEMADALGST